MRDVIKPPVSWGIIAKRFGIDPHVVKSIYEGAKNGRMKTKPTIKEVWEKER